MRRSTSADNLNTSLQPPIPPIQIPDSDITLSVTPPEVLSPSIESSTPKLFHSESEKRKFGRYGSAVYGRYANKDEESEESIKRIFEGLFLNIYNISN